ncbi:MAG: hypothetical protein MKZ56_04425 [Candidatus Thalassarchaeum sp.]|nr:hypothetical protein [Candidatus Thalassarchaeum sp.]
MENTIRVQITDKSGEQLLELSPTETVEAIQQNSTAGTWTYVDQRLTDPGQIDEANLSTVSSVRIMPALVGGY